MKRAFLLLLFLLPLFWGCNFFSEKPKGDDVFYETTSSWDVRYIPIIPPYRAISTTRNEWHLGKTNGHILTDISAFGVSKNYIYGTTDTTYPYQKLKWFLLNTTNHLYCEYNTKAALDSTLTKYKIEKKPINKCAIYYPKINNCYWKPQKGDTYPKYADFRPDSCIDVIVKGGQKEGIKFSLSSPLKKTTDKIYYFRMRYDKKDNDLFYVTFDSKPTSASDPKLIKDGLIIPAFAWGNYIEVAVYTPYPVGKEKGIKESERIVVSQVYTLE